MKNISLNHTKAEKGCPKVLHLYTSGNGKERCYFSSWILICHSISVAEIQNFEFKYFTHLHKQNHQQLISFGRTFKYYMYFLVI